MGVDGDGLFAEGDIEHDIGGLAPDAGQRFQRRAIFGTSPLWLSISAFESAMTFLALLRNKPMVLMCSVSPASPSLIIFCGVSAMGKSFRRLVDALVGRLRRKHDRDEQRIGIDVVQFGAAARDPSPVAARRRSRSPSSKKPCSSAGSPPGAYSARHLSRNGLQSAPRLPPILELGAERFRRTSRYCRFK